MGHAHKLHLPPTHTHQSLLGSLVTLHDQFNVILRISVLEGNGQLGQECRSVIFSSSNPADWHALVTPAQPNMGLKLGLGESPSWPKQKFFLKLGYSVTFLSCPSSGASVALWKIAGSLSWDSPLST